MGEPCLPITIFEKHKGSRNELRSQPVISNLRIFLRDNISLGLQFLKKTSRFQKRTSLPARSFQRSGFPSATTFISEHNCLRISKIPETKVLTSTLVPTFEFSFGSKFPSEHTFLRNRTIQETKVATSPLVPNCGFSLWAKFPSDYNF